MINAACTFRQEGVGVVQAGSCDPKKKKTVLILWKINVDGVGKKRTYI